MYSAIARICQSALPLVYGGAFAAYALAFFRRDVRSQQLSRVLLIAALVVHTSLIYVQTMAYGHCLVYSPFEMLTLISFTVTLTYLVVELTSGERSTGMFFTGLALLLQTVSAMFSPTVGEGVANPVLLSDAVGLHISAALIGYTAFAISAVYGGLYLMLYRSLKANRFGTFFQRLPSLQLLERMSEKSAIVGVLFLTIAIVIAMVWLPRVLPAFSYGDPKLIGTAVVWLVYVAALVAKYVIRIDGRRVVMLTLVGFIGTIVSMTVVNLFLSGFHRFVP